MEPVIIIARSACIALLALLPALNVATAQRDVPLGISPRTVRRAWAFSVLIPFFGGAAYWFELRPLLASLDSQESAFSTDTLIVGIIALAEAIYFSLWGLHSVGPTLLVFYIIQRSSRGPAWCVETVQREVEVLHAGPWPRRLFILQTIAFQSVVAFLIAGEVTMAILERRMVGMK